MLERLEKGNPKMLSPLTLAFVGDAVYGLLVRQKLAGLDLSPSRLHPASVRLVRAEAQARAAEALFPRLTEEEQGIFKRGRNAHTGGVPKTPRWASTTPPPAWRPFSGTCTWPAGTTGLRNCSGKSGTGRTRKEICTKNKKRTVHGGKNRIL